MCSAFLEVRLFTGVYSVKWVMMGLSHSHGFASFPERVPRSTFSEQTLERFEEMARQNKTSAEIAMANDVFCDKHIFQNAMRPFRCEKRADQAREIRDAVRSSDLWNSEIHSANDNVFEAMFFVNWQLVAKGVQIDVVYVDDTSCTNVFHFPSSPSSFAATRVMSTTSRGGSCENRTTESFEHFFRFLFASHPDIHVFVCDRHYA